MWNIPARPDRILTGLALGLCLLAAWFAPRIAFGYWQTVRAGKAGVSVENPRFVFGVVEPGDLVSHRFRIANDGSHTVKIRKVQSSCSCTVAKPAKRELQPGESVEISVSLDTNEQYGTVAQTVAVVTDTDPAIIRLQMVGEVRMLFTPPSKSLTFTFTREKTTGQEFWITRAGTARRASLQLRQESVPDYLQLSLKHVSENALLVCANVIPEKAPERFSVTAFLDPNDSTLPSYPIHIEGQLQHRFTCLPPKLYLGTVKPGEVVHRRLALWANDSGLAAPVKISLSPQAPASCEVTLEETRSEHDRWDLDFRIQIDPNQRSGGRIAERVLLECDGRDRVEIPLEAFLIGP